MPWESCARLGVKGQKEEGEEKEKGRERGIRQESYGVVREEKGEGGRMGRRRRRKGGIREECVGVLKEGKGKRKEGTEEKGKDWM